MSAYKLICVGYDGAYTEVADDASLAAVVRAELQRPSTISVSVFEVGTCRPVAVHTDWSNWSESKAAKTLA